MAASPAKPAESHNEEAITPFSYPKARNIHRQRDLYKKLGEKNLENRDTIYASFFKSQKCWEAAPSSSKLIILDTKLLIQKAFNALRFNGLRAAPLWNSAKQQFVGMLTITDFIVLLITRFEHAQILQSGTGTRDCREPSPILRDMNNETIEEWCQQLEKDKHAFIGLDTDESLFVALDRLLRHKVHRLPLMNSSTGDPLYILTHKRLLRYLFIYIYDLPTPPFMFLTLAEAKIGTFTELSTVTTQTKLLVALKLFTEKRISALPIVDEKGRLENLYSKFDVIHLAANQTADPEMTMLEAMEKRPNVFSGVVSCRLNESIATVSERIARHEVHRLVVVDDENKVIGIVSLSDLLKYLIFRPTISSRSSSSSSSNTTPVASPSRRDHLASLSRSRTQSETIPEVSDEY